MLNFNIDDTILKLIIVCGLLTLLMNAVFYYLKSINETFKDVIILIIGTLGGFTSAKVANKITEIKNKGNLLVARSLYDQSSIKSG
jgi:hypothetical protein